MSESRFVRCAAVVLMLIAGFAGRLAHEQATAPAYAQDADPTVLRDCADFRSQAEAQAELRRDPSDPNVLDEDDGPAAGFAASAFAASAFGVDVPFEDRIERYRASTEVRVREFGAHLEDTMIDTER